MAYRIRKMKDTDAIAVCKLVEELGYELDSGQFLGRFLQLNEEKNHTLWVMESPETGVCALAHFERSLGLVHPPRLEVKALVVEKASRRKGLAKRFMLYAESFARTEDLMQVFLRCNITRSESHEFYETIGYQKMKTSHSFLKNV
jgi:N-acetylglutamate synthase-like GNAT family acetyltransferase